MRSILAALLVVHSTALAQAPGYSGHGAGSVPADVLAQFAPPALPPALSRKIQAMLDVRSPGPGMVSPDGKRLFFNWRVTGTRQIWRLDGPQRFPVQLTGGEDSTSLAGMAPDGRWLVDGTEFAERPEVGRTEFPDRADPGSLHGVETTPSGGSR